MINVGIIGCDFVGGADSIGSNIQLCNIRKFELKPSGFPYSSNTCH